MVDLQGYQVELKESLDAALKNPAKLLALIVAMEKAAEYAGHSSYRKHRCICRRTGPAERRERADRF